VRLKMKMMMQIGLLDPEIRMKVVILQLFLIVLWYSLVYLEKLTFL